jgi:hypothetical protein
MDGLSPAWRSRRSAGRRWEEVPHRAGQRQRWIRFLHPDQGYINDREPIPIYIAARGSKTLKVVGELADGWITPLPSAEGLRQGSTCDRIG